MGRARYNPARFRGHEKARPHHGRDAKTSHRRGAIAARSAVSRSPWPRWDERAARVDRLLPIIIDDELGAMAFAKRLGLLYFRADICIRLILDPQLHEPHTAGQKPGDPSRAVDDHIERVKHARDR